jgi:hypothetical protein
MTSFLLEWFFVLGALCALGLAGGFALVPFRTASPFLYLAAPLAGLLLLALGISGGHSILGLGVPIAGLAVLACGAAATLTSLAVLRPRLHPDTVALAAALVVSAMLTATTTAATIRAGSPSLGFVDGSDQFGYATLADWLFNQPAGARPVASPDLPYQSWPQYIFESDPRFGSLHFLAFIAWLRGTSGLFAFDSANAVALAAGTIGVAAIFAASRRSLLLLLAGLATGYWYDHSRGGYFGKLMSYPGDIFLLRLLFHELMEYSAIGLVVLTVLTGAVATLHSSASTAAVLLPAGTAWLGARALLSPWDRRTGRALLDGAAIILLVGFVAMSQSGLFARPGANLGLGMAEMSSTWTRVLLAGLDLENDNPPITGLPQAWLIAGALASVSVFGALLALAIRSRSLSAIALLAGPSCTFLVLYATRKLWPAYQLIGIYDTEFLCAAALLIDLLQPTRRLLAWAAFAATGLVILLHQPRFLGALDRFALGTPPMNRYSRCEMDEIARIVGRSPVRVDLPDIHSILVVLGDLGRRDADLQWEARPWKIFLGYRPWPAPSYVALPEFRLTGAAEPAEPNDILLQTPHFILSRVPEDGIGAAPAERVKPPADCRVLQDTLSNPATTPRSALAKPAAPSAVRRFPDGLLAPGLFFAGVSQDGWLGAAAQTKLFLEGGSNLLYLKGEVPDFSAKITSGEIIVSVDGAVVLKQPQKLGPFDLSIPLPEADGVRRIDLRMSGVDALPEPDGRQVSIRLSSIVLGRNDDDLPFP